jgi:hypothetical protein
MNLVSRPKPTPAPTQQAGPLDRVGANTHICAPTGPPE